MVEVKQNFVLTVVVCTGFIAAGHGTRQAEKREQLRMLLAVGLAKIDLPTGPNDMSTAYLPKALSLLSLL